MIESGKSGFKRQGKNILELAYENKLKRINDESSKVKKMRARKIGSVHNKKINYDVDECFFIKEDIPEIARKAHEEIKTFTDPDYLGMMKKQWNSSVLVPKNPEKEQDHQRRLLNIRIGLQNHPIIKTKEKKIPAGTDLRDDFTGWNVSTYFTRRNIDNTLPLINKKASLNSKKFPTVQSYTAPIKLTKTLINQKREEKLGLKERQEEMFKEMKKKHPTTPDETLIALIQKQFVEEAEREKQLEYYNNQKKMEKRVKIFMAEKYNKEKEIDRATGNVKVEEAKSNDFGDEHDQSAAIARRIRRIKEIKKKKKKKKRLKWIYDGF